MGERFLSIVLGWEASNFELWTLKMIMISFYRRIALDLKMKKEAEEAERKRKLEEEKSKAMMVCLLKFYMFSKYASVGQFINLQTTKQQT